MNAPVLAQDRPTEPEAAEGDETPAGVATPSTSTRGSPADTPAVAGPPADPRAEAAKFAQFDELRPLGQSSDLPGNYDSLLRDAGGFRTRLYENGLWFRGSSVTSATYDILQNNPRNPRQYTGQQFTAFNTSDLRLGWRIAQSGEDVTQIGIGVFGIAGNWFQIGPNGFQFSRLDIYKTFGGRKVEVLAGFGNNLSNYIGIFAGGNPLLASGLANAIPIQVGISGSTAPTPLLNVQVNGGGGFYSKSGIQRSIGPDGLIAEARDNGVGLKLTRRGAKPLVIQEFGLRRAAAADTRQIWLRAGGLYNSSNYTRFDGRGTGKNWAAYALADYQIVKPDDAQPYRGVFLGASALFASPKVNAIHRNLELRAYAIGMIPGRTSDTLTLTLAHNNFSRDAGRAIMLSGRPAERYQWSAGILYAAHLTRGIYLTPTVTYLRNPAFAADYKPALNMNATLTLLF